VKSWEHRAFGGPEVLVAVEGEPPEPGPGEVVVQVAYCGVNPLDVSVMQGRFKALPLPHRPGSEVAGTITAVGAGVITPRLGDRVVVAFRLFCKECYYCRHGRELDCRGFAHLPGLPIFGLLTPGGYAESVLAPADNIVAVPEGLPFAAACAATLDGVTAYHLVDRAGVGPADTVLLVGATGGIGAFALQFAANRGATVLALGRGAAAAARLRAWGASEVLDRDREDVVARLQELSGGRGADVVLDPLGAGTWPQSMAALAQGGRYATCGVLTGAEVTLDLGRLYNSQQQIIGSTGGSRADLAAVLSLLAAAKAEAPIWRTFPLAEAPAAVAALGAPGRIGKVLLAAGEN